MLKTRVIPCLLLKGEGLVKTVRFREPKYVGDPINAVKIFNDKEVDELCFLDIDETNDGNELRFDLIAQIASECFMPLSYGGGIKNVEQIENLLKLGVEKVVINTSAIRNQNLISQASRLVGSQSIVVSIDVKGTIFGKYRVYSNGGRKETDVDLFEYCSRMEEMGAGELLLASIDRDGTQSG